MPAAPAGDYAAAQADVRATQQAAQNISVQMPFQPQQLSCGTY